MILIIGKKLRNSILKIAIKVKNNGYIVYLYTNYGYKLVYTG